MKLKLQQYLLVSIRIQTEKMWAFNHYIMSHHCTVERLISLIWSTWFWYCSIFFGWPYVLFVIEKPLRFSMGGYWKAIKIFNGWLLKRVATGVKLKHGKTLCRYAIMPPSLWNECHPHSIYTVSSTNTSTGIMVTWTWISFKCIVPLPNIRQQGGRSCATGAWRKFWTRTIIYLVINR